jgi:hypothetical protein
MYRLPFVRIVPHVELEPNDDCSACGTPAPLILPRNRANQFDNEAVSQSSAVPLTESRYLRA